MRRTLGMIDPHHSYPAGVAQDAETPLCHPFRVGLNRGDSFSQGAPQRRPWAPLFNAFGVQESIFVHVLLRNLQLLRMKNDVTDKCGSSFFIPRSSFLILSCVIHSCLGSSFAVFAALPRQVHLWLIPHPRARHRPFPVVTHLLHLLGAIQSRMTPVGSGSALLRE